MITNEIRTLLNSIDPNRDGRSAHIEVWNQRGPLKECADLFDRLLCSTYGSENHQKLLMLSLYCNAFMKWGSQ